MANETDFNNLDTDIANIGKFANDPAGNVVPRFGAPYPNLRQIILDLAGQDIGESAAALINQKLNEIGSRGVVGAGDIAARNSWSYGPAGLIRAQAGDIWLRTETDEAGVPTGEIRMGVWRLAGQKHLGAVVTATGWYEFFNQSEMKNLAIGFTNFLPQEKVANLLNDFARYDEKTLNARISGFRARALTTGSDVVALLEWQGYADFYKLFWDGYEIKLSSDTTSFNTANSKWADQTALIVTADSMLDGKWAESAASELGLTLTNVSKYSSGSKQVYRLGVRELYFTVSGNVVPASGNGVNVTVINGVAPSANEVGGNPSSYDAFAAHGFLNTSAGDNISTHCSESGWLGGRHGVVSVPNAGTPVYTFTPDDGLPASAIEPQSLFVPDNLAKLKTNEVLIRLTQNTFFAGPNNPVFPNDINPRVLEDIGLIVDATSGQRVSILSLTPASDFLPGTATYNALRYFNNQLRSLWPQQTAYIPGIGTNFDYIRAHGSDGSLNDTNDISNGLLPRSCTADGLHLNAKGQNLEKQFWLLWRNYQQLPPEITEETIFILSAEAFNARTETTTKENKVAAIDFAVARNLYNDIENLQDDVEDLKAASAIGGAPFYGTRAAGAAAVATGGFFTSNETGSLRRYERTSTAPNYVDRGLAVGKNDVGLNNVDNTSDANKPISAAALAAFQEIEDTISDSISSLSAGFANINAALGRIA